MSNLAPQLLVILQEIIIQYINPIKLLQNNFRTELEWLNILFLTKKGSCSLSIFHKPKSLKLRACFELSDLSITRTIRFFTFYPNLSKKQLLIKYFSQVQIAKIVHFSFELSADLPINRTIRFHAFYANLSNLEMTRIVPQHMF